MSANKKDIMMNTGSMRNTPRLDAQTIISYAKKFQDYDYGGHNPLKTGTRMPIGSVPSTFNQL